MERGHPHLCVYAQPSKRVNIECTEHHDISMVPPDTISKSEWERLCEKFEGLEHAILDLKDDLKQVLPSRKKSSCSPPAEAAADGDGSPGPPWESDTTDGLMGETVYLGSNSVPAMVVALSKGSEDTVHSLAGRSILPVFALDNESATYPFVDLWGLPQGSGTKIEELSKLIPRDTDCLELFRHYRDTAHVLFPGVVDIDQFEWDITEFLTERSRAQHDTPTGNKERTADVVYGKSLHWVGLLFAVLASGCQCSNRDRRQRQLASQVYSKRPPYL